MSETNNASLSNGLHTEEPTQPLRPSSHTPESTELTDLAPGQLRVIKRNGQVVPFDVERINVALIKAYLDVEGHKAAASDRVRDMAKKLAYDVYERLMRRLPSGGIVDIEEIQDQVELALMRNEQHKVARSYVLYREKRAETRAKESTEEQQPGLEMPDANLSEEVSAFSQYAKINVVHPDGTNSPLDIKQMYQLTEEACNGLEGTDANQVMQSTLKDLFDNINSSDVSRALVMNARALVEQDPNYSKVAARFLLDELRRDALEFLGLPAASTQAEMAKAYPQMFKSYIARGIELQLLSPQLGEFDLNQLGEQLIGENDLNFTFLGLQILRDRYLMHSDNVRFELPQVFFMRVAMGLAIQEDNREERALEFYRLLSSFDYMSSTPTLFNAGTLHSQLSSCYLTTVPDDLSGIYGSIHDNAMLSKWAGGLGNDWTPVRALGSSIKGTNGKSQGIVPFLKVASDTAVAVNQGGKRKGAVCAYLETWHMDIEEFLDLRKNTGDERRRTHDMNTANWVPDLFMQRVFEEGEWTLFSPSDTPDLHDLYGKKFTERYQEYERMVEAGEITHFKKVAAANLWRKMLERLYETGHPWITFKDTCNLRSPQQHIGVVHSSNLCTEITLNTSNKTGEAEIAVCNLGSINLAQHVTSQGLDLEKLKKTVKTAIRMLDNVIDINYYAVDAARASNMKHRPIGLGMMGLQDALIIQRIPYASDEAVRFSDGTMEAISYYAISASSDLAAERGSYASYKGSLWSQGILPLDSLNILSQERDEGYTELNTDSTMDWDSVRKKVASQGMRNSNVMAIAPTATIANITGVTQSTEPTYENLYVKSNLSGEFTVLNPYLVHELKEIDLWDEVMVHDLKYYEGRLSPIQRIPDHVKQLYASAFEIEPRWLIEAAARRQKWIDQSQSLNLYFHDPSGKQLDIAYRMAWLRGLKTTYYLRSLAATSTEKSTVDNNALNAVSAQSPTGDQTLAADFQLGAGQSAPSACTLDDPDCDACQ